MSHQTLNWQFQWSVPHFRFEKSRPYSTFPRCLRPWQLSVKMLLLTLLQSLLLTWSSYSLLGLDKSSALQSAFSRVFGTARVDWRGNKTSHFSLCQLHELQDRNMECLGMLHESQEEIKELRSKSGPSAHLCFSQSYGVFTGVRNNEGHHVPKGRKEKFGFCYPECGL